MQQAESVKSESRSESEDSTDLRHAEKWVEEYGGRTRYVYSQRRWLVWDGRCWGYDDTGAVERFAKANAKGAEKFEAASRISATLRLARSDQRVAIRVDDLDADSWALNAANGIVDLKSGALRPHDAEALHSKMTRAGLPSGDIVAGPWDAFLLRVLPDADVRRYVQKLVGYSLTGEIGANVLPFAYGSGANGKSVFLSAIRHVLGSYATEGAPDLLVARRERGIPVDVADLRGYRFVTTTEVEAGRKMATDVMKRLTGESMLKARLMRQNFEEFRNVSTIWMAANDRPQVSGLDDAVWRRVRMIPFTVTIPENERDPHLLAKLLDDGDAILGWAVQGCLAWQAEGLTPPDAVVEATAEYRDESNPLAEWAEARCVIEPAAVEAAQRLRESYEEWCGTMRVAKIPRGAKWKESLQRLGCSQPADPRGRAYVDGVQVVAWEGIKLI